MTAAQPANGRIHEAVAGARALILACSPRAEGNTDQAARTTALALEEQGLPVALLPLRDYCIGPCNSCGVCKNSPEFACVQAHRDDAEELFQALCDVRFVVVCSPIYFYHLPSQLKAWIDRSQSWYLRRQAGDPKLTRLAPGSYWPVLAAGRSVGERLFDGALITLKYFFHTFGLQATAPALLRGVDRPGDLAADAACLEALRAAAAQAVQV